MPGELDLSLVGFEQKPAVPVENAQEFVSAPELPENCPGHSDSKISAFAKLKRFLETAYLSAKKHPFITIALIAALITASIFTAGLILVPALIALCVQLELIIWLLLAPFLYTGSIFLFRYLCGCNQDTCCFDDHVTERSPLLGLLTFGLGIGLCVITCPLLFTFGGIVGAAVLLPVIGSLFAVGVSALIKGVTWLVKRIKNPPSSELDLEEIKTAQRFQQLFKEDLELIIQNVLRGSASAINKLRLRIYPIIESARGSSIPLADVPILKNEFARLLQIKETQRNLTEYELLLVGMIYQADGMITQAEACFQQLPNNPFALTYLGNIHRVGVWRGDSGYSSTQARAYWNKAAALGNEEAKAFACMTPTELKKVDNERYRQACLENNSPWGLSLIASEAYKDEKEQYSSLLNLTAGIGSATALNKLANEIDNDQNNYFGCVGNSVIRNNAVKIAHLYFASMQKKEAHNENFNLEITRQFKFKSLLLEATYSKDSTTIFMLALIFCCYPMNSSLGYRYPSAYYDKNELLNIRERITQNLNELARHNTVTFFNLVASYQVAYQDILPWLYIDNREFIIRTRTELATRQERQVGAQLKMPTDLVGLIFEYKDDESCSLAPYIIKTDLERIQRISENLKQAYMVEFKKYNENQLGGINKKIKEMLNQTVELLAHYSERDEEGKKTCLTQAIAGLSEIRNLFMKQNSGLRFFSTTLSIQLSETVDEMFEYLGEIILKQSQEKKKLEAKQ